MLIDIHHHLVYGVDDGAASFSGTEKMIRDAVENRINAIITTPHMTPGIEPFPNELYRARLEEARAWIRTQGIDLALYPGAEILYTPNTPHMLAEGRVPTLADSGLALVEFLPDCGFGEMENAGKNVARAGYVPVFAHIERYACLRNPGQVRRLREACGALMQVNANTVLRKLGFFRQRHLNALFENGLVDFIASDSHDLPGRENRMAEAFDWLSARYGEKTARALTYENAEKLIVGITEQEWKGEGRTCESCGTKAGNL